MNILFAKETVGASVKEGTKPKVSVLTAPLSITPNTANDGFTIDYGGGKVIGYTLTGNVIKVNAVDVTASGAEVIGDKLRDEVFPKAGGAASLTSTDFEFATANTGPILRATDGSKFRLTVVKDPDNTYRLNISDPL